ncbi:MAG: wax ester/triacylglycerol synthase family O-acyltransferase [Candidatus Dormibacteraeota bacterium]|nr:wax ester/triacylglycerol synthase family O-acyltransferase [Candidatus Dormibacteraeota bacterium]
MAEPFYEPLSARDAWFLYAERPSTPLDLGTVYVFEGASRIAGGRGALGIEETIGERIHLVPRYRQRIHHVPMNVVHPVWIDDPHFDLGNHVRREELPPPGDGAALRRLVMRILSRPLDMRRPLWEMTVVTGLRNDRAVIVNRAHHAMVDGVSTVDILTLLLDTTPESYTPEPPKHEWEPRGAPTNWQLTRPMLWNVGSQRRDERTLLPAVWNTTRVPWKSLFKLSGKMVSRRPDLFFNRKIGSQRTGRGLKVPLSAFKALKDRFGCTVNDAVLAVVAEGLHRWFKVLGEEVPDKVRVFCPVSVHGDGDRGRIGNQISGMVLELPTGDLTIEERLRSIKITTGDLKRTRQAVAADKLAGLADWAPPSLLVLAGRLMSNPQGGANINVTNVPGPQFPLYSGGAELLEVWPFAPLYPSMGLGIAIVSYNGQVYFGLTADPGLIPDVEEFTAKLQEAAAECAALATGPAST